MSSPFDRVRPMRVGVLFALLTFGFGFGLGGLFGAAEDSLKDHLTSTGEAVLATVYKGDSAKLKATTSKSWSYFKRAHLHAGGMGAAALSMILLLSFLSVGDKLKAATAGMLGVGGLGYSSFWLLAGLRAPALGGTDAAKESLEWLAIPTSGMFIVGLAIALGCFVYEAFLGGGASANADA